MAELTNRAKQAIRTKNRIYDCGVQLIRSQGFSQVTVEQIARTAGVSVGTYYYYFESKMDLFREIFIRADNFFSAKVREDLSTRSARDQILGFFDHYVTINLQDGVELIKKLYTSENKLFTLEGRGMQMFLADLIKRGQDDGEIKSARSPDELTRLLFMAARGVVFDWCIHDGSTSLKDDMRAVMTLMANRM